MPRIDSRQMQTYVSDLGLIYKNVRFKMKGGRSELAEGCETYDDPIGICPTSRLIKQLRALVVKFSDGETVRFPISNPVNIADCVRHFLAITSVECIDLDGEEWGVVPPTLGGYTPVTTVYSLPTGGKADKATGSYDYTSDVIGLIGDKFAVEDNPEPLATQLLGCPENKREKDRCVLGAGIKARHVLAIANGAGGSVIARKGKVSSVDSVLSCISAVGNRVLCVGYKGESIRNVHLLINPTDSNTP